MKRVSLTVVIVLLAVCIGLFGAVVANNFNLDSSNKSQEHNNPYGYEKVRVADANMYPDDYEYIDYAEEVKFDTEKYPLLENQGLFWLKWDEEAEEYVKVSADTDEGSALVDPSKPTIINIHGMLVDGYYTEEMYWVPEELTSEEELGYSLPVQYFKFWFDKGYNVGMYSYQKFAAEGGAYHYIEEKMWSTEGKAGIRYRKPDMSFDEDVSDYCLSEHFAADYIRAMNRLPANFGNAEIRFAAHSMGGEIVTGGTFLLTELADVGQLNPDQLPDRITMEDTFFGATVGNIYAGQKDLPLRWSGKTTPDGTTSQTIIECIKDISINGIVFEYYSEDSSFLRVALSKSALKSLIDNSVYVIVDPDFASNRHNGVRDFYLASLLRDYDDSLPLTDAEKISYAASLPTDVLRTLVGKCFTMTGGNNTLTANDDVYIENTEKYYPSL